MIRSKSWRTLPPWVYLTALSLAGALLRLWDIAKSSIWHDEGFTMMLAPMSPSQIVARTARDVHPPLYYLVLHYWILLFGHSETAARGLSAVFLTAAIPVTYLLMRRLWTAPAAWVAAGFVAMGPFIIRYSQEARMYGMVAFLMLLATYFLVRALERNRWGWWLAYALTIAAALYTHYYTIFIIIAHWAWMIAQARRKSGSGIRNPRWWGSNVLAAALFLPWLPTAYHQYTRVQAGFWIPRVTITTIPSTMFQFLSYTDGSYLGIAAMVGLGFAFIALIAVIAVKQPTRRKSLLLLSLYCLTGPILVWIVSLGKRSIYVDRYFVFAAIAFYSLLAVFVTQLPKRLAIVAGTLCVVLFAFGNIEVHITTDHQMKVIGNYVNTHYRPGDEILSGELYTFFDFSYYNHTGATVHLWSKNGVDGYSESSLIYDRASQIVVEQLDTIHPASGKLWVVGKPGYKQYYDPKIIPSDWRPIGPRVTAADSTVQEYLVAPRSSAQVAVQ
jgi:mannosyltransferase